VARSSCFPGPPAEVLVPATFECARRCPARPGYLELCFTTPEGSWTWCFPRPRRRRREPAARIALTIGPYGVLARRVRDGGLGTALPGSAAVPMILSGADVSVERRLVMA
jgi:hypothetical protein